MRDELGSTLRMSLDRRVLDVVSPERTFTGIGAHYRVTSASTSCGMADRQSSAPFQLLTDVAVTWSVS
jgi:hypothetical protein